MPQVEMYRVLVSEFIDAKKRKIYIIEAPVESNEQNKKDVEEIQRQAALVHGSAHLIESGEQLDALMRRLDTEFNLEATQSTRDLVHGIVNGEIPVLRSQVGSDENN